MSQTIVEATGKDVFLGAYEDTKDQLNGGGAWFASIRESAIEAFDKMGMPNRKMEQWRKTPLRKFEKIPFRATISDTLEQQVRGQLSDFIYDEMDAYSLVFLNGILCENLSSIDDLPAGLTVTSLRGAINEKDESVLEHLAKHADHCDHPFIAINTALFEDGAFISLDANTIVDKPIHAVYLCDSPGGASAAHIRNLIVVGEGAEATFVESYQSLGEDVYFTNVVSEMIGEANCSIKHYKLQRESLKAFHFSTNQVRLKRDARFKSEFFTMGGVLTRNEANVYLDGEGIECTLNGLYLIDDHQHVDYHTRLDHAKPHCNSFQVFKGIVDDHASGVFNGKIFVHEDAQKTDAKQSSKGLLLCDTASADAEPQLEIFADDVKCTHGATVGQPETDAVFYLRARGLDEAAARNLLIVAFANEIIEKIEIEPIKTRFEQLVFDRYLEDA